MRNSLHVSATCSVSSRSSSCTWIALSTSLLRIARLRDDPTPPAVVVAAQLAVENVAVENVAAEKVVVEVDADERGESA